MYKITADCIGCGACVDECSVQAILPQGDIYTIEISICNECGACVDTCPVGAIIQE